MQAANRLQKALRSSAGRSFGAWQMLPGSNLSRTIAESGFDWVCVDTEHGNIDDGAMHEAVAAIAHCGVSPIVRIASNEGYLVKRALDAGAHGIVVPLLQTAEEAAKLVSSARFPPQGIRGFGSPFAMRRLNLQPADTKQANESILTIVQIETKEALKNVDAIAKTDGVDVLLVGPFDLGLQIGHQIINGKIPQELKSAIQKILQSANENGKRAGIYATSGEQARAYADQGFHMISVVTDITAISEHFQNTLLQAKGPSSSA